MARYLVVDDDPGIVSLLVEHLQGQGDEARSATTPREAIDIMRHDVFDIIIMDVELGEIRGLELMHAVHALRPEQLVVLITAFGSMELAAQAMREGAADFIAKPFTLDVLSHVLRRTLHERRMRREIVRLRQALEAPPSTRSLVAQSAAMQQVIALAERAARVDATVVLTGESGVGKSALARLIHQASRRASQPFVQLNAAAIPEGLVESELFGARRGAYTDAREDRKGVFQRAHGGTLFLDEVGELPLTTQPKLLLALETGQVRSVGAARDEVVDLRLIVATHRDLPAEVAAGRFREDLFYRLHIIPIAIPPLRDRPEDIPPLVDHFISAACARMGRPMPGVSAAALRWLQQQAWPGNARQLANTLERAVALSDHDALTLEDVQGLRAATAAARPDLQQLLREGCTLQEVEERYLREALRYTQGNKAEAARLLQIDRRTLYRKLETLGEGEGEG